MTLKEEYQASLKSLDTEEWFDLYFHRPLGFLWAKLFAKLGKNCDYVIIDAPPSAVVSDVVDAVRGIVVPAVT